MNVPDIELKSVTKRFGKFEAVKDLDLSVEKGELVCLLGPSGCGKTTTLRMIAGFEIPTMGRIIIQGEDVTDIAPNKRNTGMVFQSYALFPHMTVFKNMAYGLKNHKVPKDEMKTRVRKTLEMLELTTVVCPGGSVDHELDLRPTCSPYGSGTPGGLGDSGRRRRCLPPLVSPRELRIRSWPIDILTSYWMPRPRHLLPSIRISRPS
jgi:ABC-type glutathione transport system ATPase component